MPTNNGFYNSISFSASPTSFSWHRGILGRGSLRSLRLRTTAVCGAIECSSPVLHFALCRHLRYASASALRFSHRPTHYLHTRNLHRIAATTRSVRGIGSLNFVFGPQPPFAFSEPQEKCSTLRTPLRTACRITPSSSHPQRTDESTVISQ